MLSLSKHLLMLWLIDVHVTWWRRQRDAFVIQTLAHAVVDRQTFMLQDAFIIRTLAHAVLDRYSYSIIETLAHALVDRRSRYLLIDKHVTCWRHLRDVSISQVAALERQEGL